MTALEIQERNEQIAIMLGWKEASAKKVDRYGYYQCVGGYSTPYRNTFDEQALEYQSDKNAFAVEDLQFHSDWNWLMEAVEFIEKIETETSTFKVFINPISVLFKEEKNYFFEKGDGGSTREPLKINGNVWIIGQNRKEAVFKAVSDFAKKFNNKEL